MPDVKKSMVRVAMGLNVSLYRMSKGKVMGKVKGMPVLLLTVAGRTTGAPHTTPVVYLEDEGRYVVTGSFGGSPTEPGWFRNLRAAEESGRTASVEVGEQRRDVSVHVADQEERARLWTKLNEKAPFFEDNYQKKTERQIPMAILTPA